MNRRERILQRLQEIGTGPKRSLGQNFLVSDLVIDRIIFAVKAEPFSEMVEVGPGLGALTEDLLTVARTKEKRLTLLELDRQFVEYWRSRAVEETQLHVNEGDALQMDWTSLNLSENSLFVSNLPYQISSSLVIERSLQPAGITRMILMFQKEVAQRISARARTKEYGLLTVIAQTFWETATVCDAGPKDFYPPPNVASRVLVFRKRPVQWSIHGASPQGFLEFAKMAFAHRRKLLARNVESKVPQIQEILQEQGLLPTARAEELDPKTFLGLYLAVVQHQTGTAR